MAKLNAASRLRDQVLSVPNTVLLVAAGRVDRVIRFNRRPNMLSKYRFDKARESSQSLTDIDTPYTVLNMDKGPDAETWRNIEREVNQTSRRDRPVPDPLSVAEDCHEEWSVAPEDVPLIELNHVTEMEPVSPSSAPVIKQPKKAKDEDVREFIEGHTKHPGRHGKKCFKEPVNA